jgi:hypothetical protein
MIHRYATKIPAGWRATRTKLRATGGNLKPYTTDFHTSEGDAPPEMVWLGWLSPKPDSYR